MMNVRGAILLAWTSSFVAGAAAGQGLSGPTTARDDDAAAMYREAFRLLPKLTGKERQAYSCQGDTCGSKLRAARLTKDLVEPVNRSESALVKLRAAANCRKCDWDLSGAGGVNTLPRDVSRASLLIKVAVVRARQQFERGQAKAAVADLAAAQTLAHRLGKAGPLICLLVQNKGDLLVAEIAAKYLPKLSKADLGSLAERLKKVPPGAELAGALQREKKVVAKSHAGSPLLQPFLLYYTEAEKLALLPPDQMCAKLKAIQSLAAGVLNPVLEGIARSQAEARLKQVMLKSAIQVLLEGREALKNQPDPYTGQSLEYEQLEKGFRLKSKTTVKGQPVTLDIG